MIERDDSLDGDSVPWSDQSDWLDPGGGDTQEYVQDCEVCCRPWQVQVRYDTTGSAEVMLEATE